MRLSWPALCAALAQPVDRAALVAGLRALHPTRETAWQVRRWLAEAHPWQAGCPAVGDETLRGFCWCHSPWRGGDPAELLADELLALRDWYRDMVAFIEDRRSPALHDAPDQMVTAIVEAIGHIVASGIHDSWYQAVPPVVAWLLEAQGVLVDEGLEEQIHAHCELSFTSWTTPASGTIQSVAEAVVWDALEAMASARWPG